MSEVVTVSSEARWFAVHVLSGQETNVKRHMLSRIKTEELGEVVQEVIIPTERISEIKRGKKVETERKLYPGYIFVKMELYDAEKKLHEVPWYFVKETPGVLGFADGDRPTPMKPDEVEGMLSQIREKERRRLLRRLFLQWEIESRWGMVLSRARRAWWRKWIRSGVGSAWRYRFSDAPLRLSWNIGR